MNTLGRENLNFSSKSTGDIFLYREYPLGATIQGDELRIPKPQDTMPDEKLSKVVRGQHARLKIQNT